MGDRKDHKAELRPRLSRTKGTKPGGRNVQKMFRSQRRGSLAGPVPEWGTNRVCSPLSVPYLG